ISGWTASGSGTTLTIIGQTALLEKQIGIPVFPTTYSLYTWLFLTVNIHVIPPITYLNGYSFDGLGSLVFPQELTFGVISLSSEFLGSGYTCSTYPKNQVQWTNMRAYLSSPEYVMQYTGFNHLPTCGTSNTFQLGYNLDGADITLEGA
nr:hypothetical protein [Saprospiraceae bacterium]